MYLFHDCHVHLTNYIQEGPDLGRFLAAMGEKVGRAALFGIPLQQKWSYRISGVHAPKYYLQTDASLYYYSFTDAYIAMAYRALPPPQQHRLFPMITGFNPADMYGVDHIRRVLQTFPGVFTGIGEFTIHKEFVSSKLATEVPSLNDPAVDKILEFAGEAGLLALIHCDMDTPFRKEGERPTFLAPMKAMLRRHPRTTIIWAHLGLGRVIRPVKDQMAIVVGMLSDPAYDHVCFDLSWDELAKYLETTPQTAERVASVLTRYPDRFLFGTDEIGPTDQRKYMHVYELYQPLWKLLDRRVKEQVCKGNFERLFDRARHQVRAWESARGLFAPRATPHRHHVSKAPAHAHVH